MFRLMAVLAILALAAAGARADCLDFFFIEICDGSAQQLECVRVTTELSTLTGEEAPAIGQEHCYGMGGDGGSPLPERMEWIVEAGTLDLDTLTVGQLVGQLAFRAKFSDFGESCDQGDEAILEAPIVVTGRTGDEVQLIVQIDEANEPLIVCLLTYDPTDDLHNEGIMYHGYLAKRTGGGFEMALELDEDPDNFSTAIEMGDRVGAGIPVPLDLQLIDPAVAPGLYRLPGGGGELGITTTIFATNEMGEIVDTEFFETFDIEGTAKGLFRRGDVDGDGTITIGDPIGLLNHLFAGAPEPACPDTGDADDSGNYTIGDAITLLNYLFGGGSPPATPGPSECGPDPQEDGWLPEGCAYPSC